MHKDCVPRPLPGVAAALLLAVQALAMVDASELWYARAARGFDLPAAIPDPVPVAVPADSPEAQHTESCVSHGDRWFFGIWIAEPALATTLIRIAAPARAHEDARAHRTSSRF